MCRGDREPRYQAGEYHLLDLLAPQGVQGRGRSPANKPHQPCPVRSDPVPNPAACRSGSGIVLQTVLALNRGHAESS